MKAHFELFQEQLDQKLQQRQARETGICQVRRELYAQCFDELIRQCTINCTERGLLMLRVRQGRTDSGSISRCSVSLVT